MKKLKKGFLVTFEGIEASGKTTHAKCLSLFLKKKKIPCVLTREPGGTEFGRKLKKLIFAPPGGWMPELAELFLFAADRAEHVERVIKPALEAKKIVLCDRFTDSTLAYQAAGRKLPEKLVKEINQISSKGLVPNLTFLFYLDFREMRRRLALRGKATNRFEKEKISFYKRIQNYYRKLVKANRRFFLLNGSDSFEKNAGRISAALLKKIS